MPTPVTRFALAIAALTAALVLGGLGAGVAIAEPEEPSNTSEPTSDPEPSNVVEPPAAPAPTVAPTVRSIPQQLRDFLHRPLSILGNGRVPGQAPTDSTQPGGTTRTKDAVAEVDTVEGTIPPKRTVPEESAPEPVTTQSRSGSTVEVRLPFTPAFTVVVPSVPGVGDKKLSINLTDPSSTYGTIEETFATFNSLIADAYAPFDPSPEPEPGPAMRTFQEGPVLDVDGSTGGDGSGITTVSAGPGGDLPVVQAPVAVPRVASPVSPGRVVRGVSPVPDLLAGGSAGARTPSLRGSVAPTGTVPAEAMPAPAGGATPMGTPSVRQGYPQSLRVARMGEIAVVAVPGLAGLLALTFGGGLIGYRQANSGRYLRQDAVRFVR